MTNVTAAIIQRAVYAAFTAEMDLSSDEAFTAEFADSATLQTGPFETADDTTDVAFVVEDRKLYFNKMILGMCSPVFKSMFTSDFKEKNAEKIPVPGKSYDHIVAFLEQLHPLYSSKPITDKTLEQILPLADKYQVESLRQKCEQYIGNQLELGSLKKNLTDNQLLMYLWLCEEYRLPKHRQLLLDLGTQRMATKFEESHYYKLVPPTAKSDLLIQRVKLLEKRLLR
ncbi:hypothetical protein BaRGS_00003595 [Batillaria attramentaria]|uniref:BTB domain-containing protein n=1 Tax=Batillaria attramentaria TaxID=370345 RepID=A0ABD0LZJ4_9CAEN